MGKSGQIHVGTSAGSRKRRMTEFWEESYLALSVLLEVEALASRGSSDGIASGVLVLALIAVAATTLVSESTAHLGHCRDSSRQEKKGAERGN